MDIDKLPPANFTNLAPTRPVQNRRGGYKNTPGQPRFADTYRAARRNAHFLRLPKGQGNNTPQFRSALKQAQQIIAEETGNA